MSRAPLWFRPPPRCMTPVPGLSCSANIGLIIPLVMTYVTPEQASYCPVAAKLNRNGYRCAARFGMLDAQPGRLHAHCHLERELDQAANRKPQRLAAGAAARHRVPAGNQVPGRDLSAR